MSCFYIFLGLMGYVSFIFFGCSPPVKFHPRFSPEGGDGKKGGLWRWRPPVSIIFIGKMMRIAHFQTNPYAYRLKKDNIYPLAI